MRVTGKHKSGKGVKRTHVDGVCLHDICPLCGDPAIIDLGGEYLSYPAFGEPTPVRFYCHTCYEKYEDGEIEEDPAWTREVILRITVEPVE